MMNGPTVMQCNMSSIDLPSHPIFKNSNKETTSKKKTKG